MALSTPLFSLCHATRRFPQWGETMRAWHAACDYPEYVQYVVSTDRRDYDQLPSTWPGGMRWLYPAGTFNHRNVDLPDSAGTAWNSAVLDSSGRFIICVADDLFPPKHWDSSIYQRVGDFSKEVVLYPNFGGNPGLIMFPMMTRAYLNRLERDHGYQGGAWYPEYFGMRADDDFTACARMDGVIIEAQDLKFEHRCPNYGLAEWDDTYRWQHRKEAYELGDRVLARRRAEGFRS